MKRCAHFSLGKDACLIFSVKPNSDSARIAALERNRCARTARRMRQLGICILHFAFCNFVLAQESTAPITRLPRVDTAVQQAQFSAPPFPQTIPTPYPQTVPPPGPLVPATPPDRPSFRRISIDRRSEGVDPNLEFIQTPAGETVLLLTGGVNVIVQGLSVEDLPNEFGPLGDLDIETDRAVIWTSGVDPRNPTQLTQQGDLPLEIYMEGNIVFRQGDRTVYADRMFYDVRRQIGTILNAELLTPVPNFDNQQYEGLVRLRAAAVRQLDHSHFVAQNGSVTTSRLEEPSYELAADTITLEDHQRPAVDPLTGIPLVDPATGLPVVEHDMLAQSESNFVYVAGVPVFYWPTLATDLEKPSYYIDSIRVRNDSVLGFQTLLEIDAFQLFSLEPVPGVEWDLNLDLLTERGLGFGTGVEYARDSFFGFSGPTTGRADIWAIHDSGLDNLGFQRRDITPEEDWRGRAFWNHRQRLIGGLLDDWTAQAEVGFISDRTFLEQYYESEWEENKDQITGVRLKRAFDNQSFSIEANARVNDFFTQTQWLPRLDHYWLGQELAGDQLTWFSHTSAAFANIGVATPPTSPELIPQFTLLPWEQVPGLPTTPISGKGERFVTRHEFDWPIDVAPFKVVPFVLGEAAHWGEDINGDDLQRAYVHTGVRASIPFWAADAAIRDPLFNLNGLAHKVVFDAEFSYADATRDINDLPLYDELDDDSIEEFRRRMFFPAFGGDMTFNPKFDPRFYALRSGLQGWVTSPSAEIADDLMALRFGMRHRLQTKRGPFGEERIVDWLTFQTNSTWFPDDERDNFGAPMGLIDYDLRWHLGDRFSILSDGAADTFGEGLRTVSIGMLLNRPARGNAYVGFRTIDGPFEAHVLSTTLNYRMSPKWIGSAGASIDFGESGTIGHSVSFTRIGESLVATLGANYDESKDNFGVSFLVEPRFLPTLSVTRRTGIEIPPVGAYGLE